jgi:hypothetical protein
MLLCMLNVAYIYEQKNGGHVWLLHDQATISSIFIHFYFQD